MTETVPLNSAGGLIVGRSSEAGETSPAVYEKAFAKLETGVDRDHPDITGTGSGGCVEATARLAGGQRSSWVTAGRKGDQLWDLVRGNSVGRGPSGR